MRDDQRFRFEFGLRPGEQRELARQRDGGIRIQGGERASSRGRIGVIFGRAIRSVFGFPRVPMVRAVRPHWTHRTKSVLTGSRIGGWIHGASGQPRNEEPPVKRPCDEATTEVGYPEDTPMHLTAPPFTVFHHSVHILAQILTIPSFVPGYGDLKRPCTPTDRSRLARNTLEGR